MSAHDKSPNPNPAPDTTRRVDPPSEGISELARVLDGYLAALEAGNPPDRAVLIAAHPHLAPQLEQALAGLEFIHQATVREPAVPAQLGDFRILREVGRGGMGVVYEAEQISLRRRVALKVLRYGAVADETAMQRFQREAETVAHLHHTNIVPIFAIGAEDGVRYYAMQFIEGQDLADLLRAEPRRVLSPRDIARWGLQAAEALAHAHQRGVIHRDIKPSNLILDRDGRIWLTDFGLARRADDVTLSVAGALLGTPRYMSPEQARASREPVDHRTDIYSLGATLYELATGRPIFEAGSPHEVLTQILHTEPSAPRLVAPEVPRDLETLILKCLAKEPSGRYPTAQALADDLRAFLEGRPIAARPPGPAERLVRWARKHRRTTATVAISAAAALVLAVAGYFTWQDRQQSLLGSLHLTTDTPNLLAEVVDADGRALTPVFPVPTAEPLSVPAGAHELRLSGSGLLSESWPLDIERRQTRHHHVQLRPRWLWTPMEVNAAELPETVIVPLGGHADLVVLAHQAVDASGRRGDRSLRRLDGATGRLAWELVFGESTLPAGVDLNDWRTLLASSGIGGGLKELGLAERVRDLDSDGTNDLVLPSRGSPSLLAVSGGSGRVLWLARVGPPPAAAPDAGPLTLDRSGRGHVVGSPLVADADGDAVPDYIACFHSAGDTYVASDTRRHRTGPQSYLGAVSGRTGTVLWRRPLGNLWEHYVNSSTDADRFNRLCRPAVARVGGRDVVVMLERERLLGFELRTGEEAWPPLALGYEPARAAELADLDGDGVSEALLVKRLPGAEPENMLTVSLLAVALPSGEVRWEKGFQMWPRWRSEDSAFWRQQPFEVTDLEGDGRLEIVLAQGRRSMPGSSRQGLEVLDAATGSNRWQRVLAAFSYGGETEGIDRFRVGPDLDGDGHRELFAAWRGTDALREEPGLVVAALSGADGRALWRWFSPKGGNPTALDWWHAGADGWPLLMVSLSQAAGRRSSTVLLAAGSGRVEHTLPDVESPVAADFDGDGILDLFYSIAPQGAPRHLVVKGLPPEPWRRLGGWQAVGDLDGDGATDLLGLDGRVIHARSGRDHRLLWQAERAPGDTEMESVLPVPDIDGDGVADSVATVNAWRETARFVRSSARVLVGFSGRDGRQLWRAEELGGMQGSMSGGGSHWSYRYPQVDWADLDGDRRAEILAMNFGQDQGVTLSALASTNGRVLWQVPMIAGGFGVRPSPGGKPLGDLNRDGVLDAVVWSPAGKGQRSRERVQLMAYDGRSGRPLWAEATVTVASAGQLLWPEPVLGDVSGDGVPDVIVARRASTASGRKGYRCDVLAVDGATGAELWNWSWDAANPDVWTPLVVRSGRGAPRVCLALRDAVRGDETARLVTLDGGGRLLLERPVSLPNNQFDSGRHVWRTAVLAEDGREDLLLLEKGQLCAVNPDSLQTRWRWSLPGDTVRVAEVRRTTAGPAELVVWSGPEAFGVGGVDGRTRWRAAMPEPPRWGGSDGPEVRRLEGGRNGAAPLLLCGATDRRNSDGETALRQAWPVDAQGRYSPPAAVPRRYATVLEPTMPKRRLPWAHAAGLAGLMHPAGVLTFLLVGVPGVLCAWAMRRRSWALGAWPLLYAVLGLLLFRQCLPALVMLVAALGSTVWAVRARQRQWLPALFTFAVLGLGLVVLGAFWQPADAPGMLPRRGFLQNPWLGRPLVEVFLGLPGATFWVVLILGVRERRWELVRWLAGVCVISAIIAAGLLLVADMESRAPEEAYAWAGWWHVGIAGAYVAGAGVLLSLGVSKGWAWLRRRFGRASTPASAAS